MSAAAGVEVAVAWGRGVAACPLEAPTDRTATAPSAQPTDTSRMDRSVMARATGVPNEASPCMARVARETLPYQARMAVIRDTLIPFRPYCLGWAAQEEPA